MCTFFLLICLPFCNSYVYIFVTYGYFLVTCIFTFILLICLPFCYLCVPFLATSMFTVFFFIHLLFLTCMFTFLLLICLPFGYLHVYLLVTYTFTHCLLTCLPFVTFTFWPLTCLPIGYLQIYLLVTYMFTYYLLTCLPIVYLYVYPLFTYMFSHCLLTCLPIVYLCHHICSNAHHYDLLSTNLISVIFLSALFHMTCDLLVSASQPEPCVKQTAAESLYRAMLPHLPQYMVSNAALLDTGISLCDFWTCLASEWSACFCL